MRPILVPRLSSAFNGQTYQLGPNIRFRVLLGADGSDHKSNALACCLEGGSCAYRSSLVLLPMSKWLTVEFDLVFYRGGPDDIARAVIIANWYRTKCINELGWSEGSTLTSLLRHLFGGLSEASVAAKKMPLLSSVGLDAGVQPVDLCDFAAVALILHDGEKGMVPRVFYKLWSFLYMPLDPEPDCYPNSKEMRRLQPRSKGAGGCQGQGKSQADHGQQGLGLSERAQLGRDDGRCARIANF